MENGIHEIGDSHRKINKYACASVIAASTVSAIFGYSECTFDLTNFHLIYRYQFYKLMFTHKQTRTYYLKTLILIHKPCIIL